MDLSDPPLTESLIDLIDSIEPSVPFPTMTDSDLIAHLTAECQHPNNASILSPQVPNVQPSQGLSFNGPSHWDFPGDQFSPILSSLGSYSLTLPDPQPPASSIPSHSSLAAPPPWQLRQIRPDK